MIKRNKAPSNLNEKMKVTVYSMLDESFKSKFLKIKERTYQKFYRVGIILVIIFPPNKNEITKGFKTDVNDKDK